MRSLAVARYVLTLLLKHNLLALLIISGIPLVAGSYVLTYLTPGTERRTFFDLVYLGVEILAVFIPLLGSTMLQIQEFEQKTIWLVLARPVTRVDYVLGRFLGLTAAGWITLLAIAAAIFVLAIPARSLPEPYFFPVIAAGLLEATVVGALATLLSLHATSYLTALSVTFGTVIAGYLSGALALLAAKIAIPFLAAALNGIYWLLPHLSWFAVRDFSEPPESWYLILLGIYALAYSGVLLALSCALFRSREI